MGVSGGKIKQEALALFGFLKDRGRLSRLDHSMKLV